ncbi:hypothetical protein BDV93DRAFT_250503 [Ceratobasidium sp. AG-I]|nr:hypothetical protein BDV93DRAFT_250503 [Ceratobasidium sp. AG-I]
MYEHDMYISETTYARQSCDPCRRRRRKCDRRTPVCSSCETRNDQCVFDPTRDQRKPAQKNYVAALEARVALLEAVLRDADARDVYISRTSEFPLTEAGEPTQATWAEISLHPVATNSSEPEPIPESDVEFVPPDDAARALVPTAHPTPGQLNAAASEEFDLGMSDYVPLVSLDMEHKLLAQFWDWQRMHLPFLAPVPFLSAYALYAQVAHPGEPIPPPPAPPPPNPLAGPSALGVPSAGSVPVTPETAQFISPLLLDAMFVIGALFYGKAELSNQFYKRAEERVIGEAANPRLATVQGVILMAMAEMGHARASAAWTLNGIAVALCVRLGMHIDATPLVRCGALSRTLFETRNFVFWTIYSTDRFHATCMGMHTLLDHRIISTLRHSSYVVANIVEPAGPKLEPSVASSSCAPAKKSAAPDAGTTWWNPATLGMGDVIVQAGWEAIRDLGRSMDSLYDGM